MITPDGCALDAEGQILAADPLRGRCLRIAEGGQITDEIAAPEGMGIFAGDDGRTLLLCGATSYMEETAEAVLLTTRAPAPHAGLP